MTQPRYTRAPSPELRSLIAPGQMLAPLLKPRTIDGLRLDVHFREDSHVHAYCGLARIIDAAISHGRLRLTAAPAYRNQLCAAGLFGSWTLHDAAFVNLLDRYLAGVKIRPSWTASEGAIQDAWGSVATPWVLLDREAVLGYPSKSAQKAARNVSMVKAARSKIARVQPTERWAQVPNCETGSELDQLAIDPEGRLVLIELKYAPASAPSVYYAPFQLLQYVHEWHQALGAVRGELDDISRSRIALGLSPASTPQLSGGLRPVLAFGEDHCSPKVEARLDRVREIACQHLPPGVPPIEIWAMRGGKPKRLR